MQATASGQSKGLRPMLLFPEVLHSCLACFVCLLGNSSVFIEATHYIRIHYFHNQQTLRVRNNRARRAMATICFLLRLGRSWPGHLFSLCCSSMVRYAQRQSHALLSVIGWCSATKDAAFNRSAKHTAGKGTVHECWPVNKTAGKGVSSMGEHQRSAPHLPHAG